MKIKWQLFRLVCILQIAGGLYFALRDMVQFMNYGNLMGAVGMLIWILVIAFSAFAISLLSRNYPIQPVEGRQKKTFNQLYLVNIVVLIYLFASVFSYYRSMRMLAELAGTSIYALPLSFTYPLLISCLVLLCQFLILYGLYVLRRELYFNFTRKQFEFESRNG